jgi:hypothetical protein
MSEPFLIAHKVRGEVAFDIAINLGSETDGDLWIIPTSGHRAYPFWYCELTRLSVDDSPYDPIEISHAYDIPFALPDHYQCNDVLRKAHRASSQPEPSLEDLI